MIEAGHSYWLAFAAALLAGLVLGAVVERVLIRPVEGKAEINAVILTLGLFIVLHALAAVRVRQPLPVVPRGVRHPRASRSATPRSRSPASGSSRSSRCWP